MNNRDVCFLTISEAGSLLRNGDLTPSDLTQACLERISGTDPQIDSFITVCGDLALEQARIAGEELVAGKDRGPLHGIPMAIKDLYLTAGIRTTAHSKVMADWVPDQDATAWAKLRQAGAILLGKLALHEFAFGGPTFDLPFPPARNPWNRDHVTGGSSSGSGAALAAGLCFGSLGTDSGGSVRNPASQCGVVGLKPTYGRVSRHAMLPLGWSVDHAGPMARTVADTALLLQAIAGWDQADPASADQPVPDFSAELAAGVRGKRLAVPRQWFAEGLGTDPDVEAAFDAALSRLKDLGAEFAEIDSQPFLDSRPPATMILTAEAYSVHEETMRNRPQDLSHYLRTRLREGAFFSAADYIQAQRARTKITRQVSAILSEYDAILTPTNARAAEAFDDFHAEARYGPPRFTNVFNITGHPAISVPMGFTSAGLPIGLQIGGPAFAEAQVLRFAAAYEAASLWSDQHPTI